jgi:hypothetical protein
MTEVSIRTQLTKKIIKASKNLRVYSEVGCYEENALSEYQGFWHLLVGYYENNADTEMGVELVSEYLERINDFFGSWNDPSLSEDCQERSEEALRELEAHTGYIKAAVERRLYPNGK